MSKQFANLKPVVEFLSLPELRKISLDLVASRTGVERKAALRVMSRLQHSGYVQIVRDDLVPSQKGKGIQLRNPVWKITNKKELKILLKSPRKPGPVRDRIWRAVRIRRLFNLTDIIKLTQVNRETVMNYIRILEANKHLRRMGRFRDGLRWHLIKDSGPERPELPEKPEAPHD